MKKPSPRRADRSPERCRAGGGLLGGKDPVGRFAWIVVNSVMNDFVAHFAQTPTQRANGRPYFLSGRPFDLVLISSSASRRRNSNSAKSDGAMSGPFHARWFLPLSAPSAPELRQEAKKSFGATGRSLTAPKPVVKPGAGERPVPVGPAPGEAEDLGVLAMSEAREIAELHEARADGGIALDSLVEREQVDVGGRNLSWSDDCEKSISEDGVPRLLTVTFQRAE
jgi:hypothetical protein